MKQLSKYAIALALLLLSIGMQAQDTQISLLGKAGYQTDYNRFGIGIEGRYAPISQMRIAPALTFMIPNKSLTGLEFDLNVHYVFTLDNTGLDLYPSIGFNMDNNKFSKGGYSYKYTKWGYNLGAGLDYYITNDDFLNVEFQYTFGRNFARIMFGYGYRF